MEGPYIALAVILGIIAFELFTWAVATNAAWRTIKNTIVFAGFGVGATLIFLIVAARVQDTRVVTGLFITLCVLGFLMLKR